MDGDSVPRENIDIYRCLYMIENALRELIIDSMEAVDGPLWYKKRLPGDVLAKYREAIKHEKNIKWTQLIPHHPIYYIDFPDLKKVIERKDNREQVFQQIFPRKDIFASTLSELEFIRNRIAHNRKATNKDSEIVKGAYTKLSLSIGEKTFVELVSRCTYAGDIYTRLLELEKECESSLNNCRNLKAMETLKVWESVYNEWWFDESYLGHELTEIVSYFTTIIEYQNLPRARGVGHKIEKWVQCNKIEDKYAKAKKEFNVILDSWRKS